VNKNAVLVVAAEAQMLGKARQAARTLAAMQEINSDRHRLERFNKEQREQLAERLSEFSDRLPQQLVMAYTTWSCSAATATAGCRFSSRPRPARITDTAPSRVRDYLVSNDRMLDDALSPAALLSSRFHIMSEDAQAVEIDKLLSYFYRLPRLPRLRAPTCSDAVWPLASRLEFFGLASGRNWDAPDAVWKFGGRVDPSEIQFQPGTWLVRAAAMESLIEALGGEVPVPPPLAPLPAPSGTPRGGTEAPGQGGQRPRTDSGAYPGR